MQNVKEIFFATISHMKESNQEVCIDKYKGNVENQQLLQVYIDWSIIRQAQLPALSKDLKLTFHTSQQTQNSNHEVNISYDKKSPTAVLTFV